MRGPMPGSGGSGYRAPDVEAPDQPAWISGEAAAEWERIVPELLKSEMLTKCDRAALAAYCQAWAELVECSFTIQDEGRFITEPVQNAKGDVLGERKKAHPALSAQRDAFARVKSFLAEFGLTPAARMRMRLMRDGGPDPLATLLAASNSQPDGAT